MTKKLFALLTLLLCLGWQLAWAEIDDLSIAGIKITSWNYNDIKKALGERLKKGNITYDPATKTLTLDGAEIAPLSGDKPADGIFVGGGQTISLVGKNKILHKYQKVEGYVNLYRQAIYVHDGKISGNGELEAGVIGVYESLTIGAVTLNVGRIEGKFSCATFCDANATLKLEESTILFGAIRDFRKLEVSYSNGYYLSEGYVARKEGYLYWDKYYAGVLGNVGKALLCPKNGHLGLMIAGEPLTEKNYTDLKSLLGDKLKKGSLAYDPTTKMLTMEDVDIDAGNALLSHKVDGLTVVVKGDCYVKGDLRSFEQRGHGNLNITGNGVLRVEGDFDHTSLVIDNVKVICNTVAGYFQAIDEGKHDYQESIELKNKDAMLIAKSVKVKSVKAGFSNYKTTRRADDEPVVLATAGCGLFIAEHYITEENATSLKTLLGDKLKARKITFDSEKRVLTLEGAEIENVGSVLQSYGDVTISVLLKGKNKISSVEKESVYISSSVSISGEGSLEMVSEKGAGIVLAGELSIKGCSVKANEIKGVYYTGVYPGRQCGILKLEDAELTASSLKDLEKLVCNRETVAEPKGAEVYSDQLMYNGSEYLEPVHFLPHTHYATLAFEDRDFEITSVNYKELPAYLAYRCKGGNVTYDPATKTLTLDGAKLPKHLVKASDVKGEESVKYILKGECELASFTFSKALHFDIVGGANITTPRVALEDEVAFRFKDCSLRLSEGIHVGKGATLTLEDCEVDIETQERGIAGVKGVDGEKLVVKNSSIRIRSPKGAICDFDEVEFLPSPNSYEIKGGTIGKHGIMDGANVSTGTVAVLFKGGIKVTPSALTFDYPQGEQEVALTAEGAWLAACDAPWVTFSQKEGSGNATLKVSVTENTTGQAREAQLVITSKANPEVKKVMTISQKLRFVHLQSIALKPETLFIVEGKKGRVAKIIFEPENASNKQVRWESKDTDIATVDPVSGEITAIAKGECLICAWSQENTAVGGECRVKVISESEVIHVGTITVKPAELSLTVGKTASLIATITPVDAMDQRIEWRSSVDGVASVKEENGVVTVTALAPGSCTITARSLEDGSTVRGSCQLTVTKPQQGGNNQGGNQGGNPKPPQAVEDAALATITHAPNPFSSQLRIANPAGVVATYAILTSTGVVVASGALQGLETTVDTSAFTPGLYLVRFTASDGSFSLKQVIRL